MPSFIFHDNTSTSNFQVWDLVGVISSGYQETTQKAWNRGVSGVELPDNKSSKSKNHPILIFVCTLLGLVISMIYITDDIFCVMWYNFGNVCQFIVREGEYSYL